MPQSYQLGRLPRSYDPRIPHLSALLAGRTLPPLPEAKDWTAGMPGDLGAMLNDSLGDCTCAAFYHALQVWSYHAAGRMRTEPDADVRRMYVEACGYDPAVPGPGPGGNEQRVLAYLLRRGAPTGPDGGGRDRIDAFVEVDPRNHEDVKRTILDCGVAYIGFNVPAYLLAGDPPPVWKTEAEDTRIIGGHAVILAGYDPRGARLVSWGRRFTMTWEFFTAYVDEVYAIASRDWITAKGTSPAGLTLAALEEQMRQFQEHPGS